METHTPTWERVLLLLCKDFSSKHMVTSISKELHLSRVGTWKILQKLKSSGYLSLNVMGSGRTNILIATLDWNNVLVEKAISFYLTEEAVRQRRWRANFAELEKVADFTILFGSILHTPRQANDIDIINIVSKNQFLKAQTIIDNVQKTQEKRIHALNFSKKEFKQELKKHNRAFIGAIKTGIILFGQENFVKFMREVVT